MSRPKCQPGPIDLERSTSITRTAERDRSIRDWGRNNRTDDRLSGARSQPLMCGKVQNLRGIDRHRATRARSGVNRDYNARFAPVSKKANHVNRLFGCLLRFRLASIKRSVHPITRRPFTSDISSIENTLMSNLTIEVWDATGNKKQLVELPADAPVNRVIAVLVDKMNLPRYSPDGQLMSYKFHHKASGRQLLDDQTLASADIHSGDVLRSAAGDHRRARGRAMAAPRDVRGNEDLPVLRRADSRVARKCRYCQEYLDPELRDAS